jgi:hypothetical protein
MKILKAALTYFALVFGAGFILGAIRVPYLVPRFGARIAELLEMPVMLLVIVLSARLTARRLAMPLTIHTLLTTGLLALALLVAAEVAFVELVQRQPIDRYIANRDPVSGGVYLVLLAMFALMPLVIGIMIRISIRRGQTRQIG